MEKFYSSKALLKMAGGGKMPPPHPLDSPLPLILATSNAVDYKPFLRRSKNKSIPASIRCNLLNEKSW